MRTTVIRFAVASFLSLSPSASPAAAQTIFKRLEGGSTCYLRLYDTEHLRRIPKQTISKFSVIAATPDPIAARHPKEFTVHFGFWVKNGGYYDAEAVCKTSAGAASCNVEGDGGSFTLTMQGEQLRVTLGKRLEVEGEKDFSPNVATDANRVMLLSTAHKDSCRQAP
jgi:hypothetical protein